MTMHKILSIGCLAVVCAALIPSASRAQESGSISLSVTPPFVQLAMKPGDLWASNLKVVNTNATDLTIYITRMNFGPEGEEGYGQFVPLLPSPGNADRLASWINISPEPVTIAPNEGAEIPFTISVPSDASPGGHYAAILVGTRPLDAEEREGSFLRVSSFISSLFFVRIAGDVHEAGTIREFSTDREWYDDPQVTFTLRFENAGNVHVQPKGFIEVRDMWGREVGKLDVNQRGSFGNVLPQSIRKFELPWSTDKNVLAAGRYTAIATLAYGQDGIQYASQTIVFWVVPIRETGAAALGLVLVLLALRFLVRSSVRRALRAHLGDPSNKTAVHADDVVDLRQRR